MNFYNKKKTPIFILIFLIVFSITVYAGTYTVTQSVSGSFTGPYVTVTNSAGGSITGGTAFRLSSTQTYVTNISGYIRLDSDDNSSPLNMTIFYSSDGTNYYAGTTVYCPIGTQVGYTINFGASTKTISALFIMPNTKTWPGYSYTFWYPNITMLLTDNTPPSISLSEQSYYSATSDMITANISDSQSGVALRKWILGSQSIGFFASSGNTFSGSSFSVTSNGTYTVYAKDVAGNESVQTINATKIDITPPYIFATASTTYEIYNIINVYVFDSQSGLSIKKWASGLQTTGYFNTGGTTFTESTITVYTNGYYTIYVKDNVGNSTVYSVYVNYVDNTITITHPISINYTIDPNNATPFSCPDITITNNSRIKVTVFVQQFKATAGGSIVFNDVLPTKYSNWSTLTAAQTKSDIALSIKIKETATGINTWYLINNSSSLFAVNITSKTSLGILNSNGATGNLSLSACCGTAWNNAYTSKHNLTLVFDAY